MEHSQPIVVLDGKNIVGMNLEALFSIRQSGYRVVPIYNNRSTYRIYDGMNNITRRYVDQLSTVPPVQ